MYSVVYTEINEEEEMAVEFPVVRPPSCGSSTQVSRSVD